MLNNINSIIDKNYKIHEGASVIRSKIGAYFGLGLFSFVCDAKIGRYCTFGSRVSVGGYSHPLDLFSIHEIAYRDTTKIYQNTVFTETECMQNEKYNRLLTIIGNDVYIGDNAVIKSGVNIGNGAVIGMGAVVLDNVEPYSVVVGNPARHVKYRHNKDVIEFLTASEWWSFEPEQIRNLIINNEKFKELSIIKI